MSYFNQQHHSHQVNYCFVKIGIEVNIEMWKGRKVEKNGNKLRQY